MAKDLNRVMLIGRLGQDPELKYTQAGVAVAKFSVATDSSWKDQDGNWQKATEWHNVTAWKRHAEICAEYLRKGSKVYLEGRLSTSSWEDENKKKHYKTEVVLNDMIMLDSKTSGPGASKSAGEGTVETSTATEADSKNDDLPF